MATYLTVRRRLRPMRFAFLIRPEDEAHLQRAIEINTCLWGGRFNAVIPAFSKVPDKWGAEHWEEFQKFLVAEREKGAAGEKGSKEYQMLPSPQASLSPSQIVQGYLDAFEPEYVVEMESGLAARAGVGTDFVLQSNEVLPAVVERSSGGIGLKVLELFQDLYEREFRFVPRHPRRVVYPTAKEPSMSLFVAVTFGAFPSDESLADFQRAYTSVLGAERVALDGSSFLRERFEGPLRIGSAGLRARGFRARFWPTLFFVDGCSTLDVIDYWNLRALGWNVLPVPRQWANSLAEPCSEFLRESLMPDRQRSPRSRFGTLLVSRSVTLEETLAFRTEIEKIQAAVVSGGSSPNALGIQWWYPRIWEAWGREADGAERCQVAAEEAAVECTPEDGRVRFDMLTPSFTSGSPHGEPAWVNAVQFQDLFRSSELAQAYPIGIKRLSLLFETIEHDRISVCSEGLVVRCRFPGWTENWHLPTGTELFTRWMADSGVQLELSDAGRVAMELIRSLGGLWGLSIVANPDILKQLNQMAEGEAESEVVPDEEEAEPAREKSLRGRSLPHKEWLGILKRLHPKPEVAAENRLRGMTTRGVLRLGVRLQCGVCKRWNWYSLHDLKDELRCERCLRKFPFPSSKPPREAAWCYRTQGPFSVGNYAAGAYTVALTIRFLTETIAPAVEASWIPSSVLQDNAGWKAEIDFAVLWQRRPVFDGTEPSLILGECKSFNDFTQDKDVARMKTVHARFPDSYCVFATLKDELSDTEKRALSDFVNDVRRPSTDGVKRGAVLVFTGRELFSTLGVPGCWRESGGRFASFADRWHWSGGLIELCDATQHLHLGMDSPLGRLAPLA